MIVWQMDRTRTESAAGAVLAVTVYKPHGVASKARRADGAIVAAISKPSLAQEGGHNDGSADDAAAGAFFLRLSGHCGVAGVAGCGALRSAPSAWLLSDRLALIMPMHSKATTLRLLCSEDARACGGGALAVVVAGADDARSKCKGHGLKHGGAKVVRRLRASLDGPTSSSFRANFFDRPRSRIAGGALPSPVNPARCWRTSMDF